MAIWGDFNKDEVIAKITEFFGDWEKGSTPIPPLPEVDYQWRNQVYYVEKNDVNQTNIFVGHIGGLTTDPDYPDRIVMNNVLGAANSGRMFNTVRTKEGLAYMAEASYLSRFAYPGFFYGVTSTKSESTVKAIRETMKVISSMQTEPPTDWELTKARDSYLNSFVFNFDSKAEVVNRLMNYDYHGIPDDFLQKTKERIENVTGDDVVAAANKNLHPDQLLVVVVGKGEDFDEPLSALGLGPVDTLDITIPSGEKKRELSITPENLERGAGILAQAVTAHGGTDKFNEIKSVSSNGTMTMIMQGQEIPLQFESMSVFHSKEKTVVSFMGRNMYSIRDGDAGWKTDQMTGGITEMTVDEIASMEDGSRRSTMRIFQESGQPGCKALFDGTGESNGRAVEFIVMLDEADETICRLAFDAETHELVSKSYWGETMAGEGNVEETYGDWKEVEGVRLPMLVNSFMDGQKIGSEAFNEYNVNVEIPEGAFGKPE